MIVRPAGATDVLSVAALRAAWKESGGGPAGDPVYTERFRRWFEREAAHRLTWLAETHGRPVGMVNLSVFERMPRPHMPQSRWAYLANMYVLTAHRNVGTGRRLLDAALDHANEQQYVRIVLAPSERSVPFYRRAGFRDADELLVLGFDRP